MKKDQKEKKEKIPKNIPSFDDVEEFDLSNKSTNTSEEEDLDEDEDIED